MLGCILITGKRIMKKFILFIFSLFNIILLTTVDSLQAQANTTKSSNERSNQNSFFDKVYQQSRAKGIINDINMTYGEFVSLCKNSVFPAYLQASQTDSTLTFEKYIADDHYEVPVLLLKVRLSSLCLGSY